VGDQTLYDGISKSGLRELLGVTRVEILDSIASTMDVAHELARGGAPAGTVVISDTQTSGRGRGGSVWLSEPGQGIWLTLLERPKDPSALEVLSLRIGLYAARALDLFATEPIRLKWPNDLYVENSKLAGILIEARWRDLELEWVAIGIGANVRPPKGIEAAGLEEGTARVDVLEELLPELQSAAEKTGLLTREELDEFDGRDFARGRRCSAPGIGTVAGISPAGELLVAIADTVVKFRSGSLVLDEWRGHPEWVGPPVNRVTDSPDIQRHG
jgi:BirA family biotin operon repressor/biotin-[acetyl-CoA-carboxylase] ligase